MTRLQTVFMLLSTTLAIGTAATASAQESTPRADLFVGYSLLPANGDDFPRVTSHGLQAGVTWNLTRSFGIVGEFGQQWSTSSDLGPNFEGLTANTTVREFLIGPRFTARGRRANAFAHGWFGRAVGDAGDNFSGFSDSGIALGGGAGIDVHITPAVAWRVQYDYVGSFADIVDNNTRFATGVVIGIGRP
jgi:hypothetical protein